MCKEHKLIHKLLFLFITISILHSSYIRDDINNIVIDTSTGLIWDDSSNINYNYKTDSSNRNYWLGAIDHCENSNLANITSWRMPNINELKSIINYTNKNPSTYIEFSRALFNTNDTIHYWSSTTRLDVPNQAWYVNFYNGLVSYDNKDGNNLPAVYVRCVSNI